MKVHLLDGTYELFRHFFAIPPRVTADGRDVAAIRGVLDSVLNLFGDGVTHLAVATDHVIESFRNELYAGYKTGDGVPHELWDQFHPLEDALTAMGVVVWPMVEYEADDALAAGAYLAANDPEVEQVLILTPDKDLAQCVIDDRIVQFDRKKKVMTNEAGVIEKFGVPPVSIPDYLALVGDSADGYPGLSGFGAKSAAAVLAKYGHLENIPTLASHWDVPGLRGVVKLADTLATNLEQAKLFRLIATVRVDCITLDGGVESLRWRGPTDAFEAVCASIEMPQLMTKAKAIAADR